MPYPNLIKATVRFDESIPGSSGPYINPSLSTYKIVIIPWKYTPKFRLLKSHGTAARRLRFQITAKKEVVPMIYEHY
jgi:hypothetical protein